MNGYYAQIIDLLKEHGCTYHRTKGSHETWYSPITGIYFTVSFNCYSRHTANDIMKDAGIKHKF